MKCDFCGGETDVMFVTIADRIYHYYKGHCAEVLKARAEAAAASLRASTEELAVAFARAGAVLDCYAALLARIDLGEWDDDRLREWLPAAAEAELVARLESRCENLSRELGQLRAQLAEREWRPVTDDWPGMGRVVAVCLRDGRVRWGERSPDLWFLSTGRYDPDTVTHALPLPAPPQEAAQ